MENDREDVDAMRPVGEMRSGTAVEDKMERKLNKCASWNRRSLAKLSLSSGASTSVCDNISYKD